MYIHELDNWPGFFWNQKDISDLLAPIRFKQGHLIGMMESIGFPNVDNIILQTLTQDVVKSSEIEGEILDQGQVRSSVARHLGIEIAGLEPIDRNVEGVVEMVLDATQNFDQPLTKARLFRWHSSLFRAGMNDYAKIRVGAWRAGPVSVVSGEWGKEKVHFDAPLASRVEHEMDLFLEWINNESQMDPVLKAAIAHLWFVTIHPFDDGNGRIARAIGDLLLARSENNSRRFYSLSAQIRKMRSSYYDILEQTQKSTLDITLWINWFCSCLEKAISDALSTLDHVLQKSEAWKIFANFPLNERQQKIINRLLDDFEGKLTSSKWAKITKCSQDTAYRDILELVKYGILIKNPDGGRSTSYSIVQPNL